MKQTLGYNVRQNVKNLRYEIFVRPLVEYCTQLWSPCNKNIIIKIESLQRNATNYALNDNYIRDYSDRLKHCELLPLCTCMRREMLDLVFIYNAFHGLNDFDHSQYIGLKQNNLRSIENIEIVKLGTVPRTEWYYGYHINRIVKLWNSLPLEIRSTELTELEKNTTFHSRLREMYW